jgi:hypothetical protein
VAHSAENRGLDRVARAQPFRHPRLALELLAIERDRKQRGEGGDEAANRRLVGPCSARNGERPDGAPSRTKLDRVSLRLRPELDAGARDFEHGCGRLADPAELAEQVLALEERDRELTEDGLLPLSALGLGRAAARARGEVADDERRGQVDSERQPVRALGQAERVLGRQEEEVEGQHARDRDEDGIPPAPEDGDRQDGEDVQRAEAENRDAATEDEDPSGHENDRRDASQERSEAIQPCHMHSMPRARLRRGRASYPVRGRFRRLLAPKLRSRHARC